MNTARIYEFLALAKVLNYSKAAGALFISQSILTRHIQDLEEELGVRLFTRTTHGVALTEAGRVFSRECQTLLKKCDSALNALRNQDIPATGSIRVALCLEFSYSVHINTFLQSFSSRYPGIRLIYDVIPTNTPENIPLEYDLFFTPCVYHNLPPQIDSFLARRHGTYAILPPGHPLLTKSSIYLHQLTGQTILVPYASELFGPYAQNWHLAEKATKGQLSSIKVDNLSTALFLVSMGKGICIAPRHAKNLIGLSVFSVPIFDRNCCFDEYLYYNDTGNPAAKLFYEEFRETFVPAEAGASTPPG